MDDVFAERQKAFERLAAIVGRLRAEGRGTRSAGLKPLLQFAEGGFDEKRLGFRSFRSFLEAAVDAGYVVIRRAPQTPDVDVLPATGPAGMDGRSDGKERVRRDIWAAFVDWRADWMRVYDRERDQVGWLPVDEPPDEREPYAALRRSVSSSPDSYPRIERISQDATLEWMREFVGELPEGAQQAALQAAFSSTRPIRAFVLTAREVGLYEEWNAKRFEHVRQRITAWAEEHELQLDLSRERALLTPRRLPDRPMDRRRTTVPSSSLESLRDRVCAAVRQMSRAELLKLSIPLEYVIRDEAE